MWSGRDPGHLSISADKGVFPLLSMSPHHQPGIPKLSMRLQLPTCQSAAPTRLQTGQAHRHGEQLRLALRKVPSRHVLDKPRRHTSGLAAESLDLLFLSCLIASGTLSLKAEAKHSLHLKDVCWLKEGGLLGGGGRKQVLPPSPLSTVGALLPWKPPELAARLLYGEVTDQSQFKTLHSPAEFSPWAPGLSSPSLLLPK